MLKNKGYTLIELMISILISMLLFAALGTFFVNNVTNNSSTLKSLRLESDMKNIMWLLSTHIRRAGYWEGGNNVLDNPADNPFNTIFVGNSNKCILFTYDAGEGPGAVNELSSKGYTEYFGFRLVDVNGVKQVQMRTAGQSMTDCDDSENVWMGITDDTDINISELTFTLTKTPNTVANPADRKLKTRDVVIALKGTLKSDTSVKHQLSEQIKIRNDLYE